MIVGYARVSREDQNLNLQLDALEAESCEVVFSEKASGVKQDRKELTKMLFHLREGDTLIVYKLDRLARSMKHLIELVDIFKAKGIHFKSLKDNLVLDGSAVGNLMFNIFGAFAQFERDLISERTKAGLEAAKKRGRKGGRRPGMTPENKEKAFKILKLHNTNCFTVTEICNTIGCARATMYKYLAWAKKNSNKQSSNKPLKAA